MPRNPSAKPQSIKPSDTASDRVDARLIAIANEHVRKFGPGKMTVVAVAEAAGMTHANVYRYFPSKNALIDAVVGEALKPIETVIADVASAPDPADDKLERLVLDLARLYRTLMEQNAPVFRLFVTATLENRAVARRHRGRIRMLVERVVDEGIATGAFEPRDREGALSFLTDVLYRFTHPSAVLADTGAPRDVLDRRLAAVVRVALRALSVGLI
ncbi:MULTISPECIES: TetR/AcrR family transcriptional regulator [unclassified Chelatococcus]|uniref:TetR/AcrR family transcriptional regulator n=1 Tax=unclassified Chelatococcus TaxID=2638111 RepID=UPI001BCC99C0|nr:MULTISPECIES: TetR/AcrR family transcriptional regulator [unclassified Chelatococcus]MBS7697130.1 TetR family transcriptional regulator [Chelatococcus sp. YT9]MBX3381841.1 TetR family transcriptional regulator [Phycisphaeraceae bacterium]MBX3559615.1 TetR family transcriptional regulator [Chelatococcus sp.]